MQSRPLSAVCFCMLQIKKFMKGGRSVSKKSNSDQSLKYSKLTKLQSDNLKRNEANQLTFSTKIYYTLGLIALRLMFAVSY